MATIEIKSLRKAYRGKEVLRELSFLVEDGEFFCLLGPPGAGKTTLFRIIAGLEQPDDGQVLLDGQNVGEVPPQRRDVAMVFEDMALYPHMTGFGNLAHPLYLQGLNKTEVEERVHAVAGQLQIEHLLDRGPSTYSGGELRRVALGRALVRTPRVLLLDQALSDLDAKIRQQMAGELKRIQRDTRQTTIYATHDYEEAIAMGDRILVMQEGQEIQTSGPEEVYWKPATKFVAGFIGTPSMNFLSCHTRKEGERVNFEHPGFKLRTAKFDIDLPEEVILGIRPEHVEYEQEGGSEGIQAVVDITQVLGEEQIIDFRLEDDTLVKFLGIGNPDWRPGDEVLLKFPEKWIYLFDSESEARLIGPDVDSV